MNNCCFSGRMGRDPEVTYTPAGVAICKFSVAVDRPGAKDREGQRITDWIPCTAWRQSAEFMGSYVQKGDLVAVSGQLQTRSYTGQDGSKRNAFELSCDKVEKLVWAPKEDAPAPAAAPARYSVPVTDEDADQEDEDPIRAFGREMDRELAATLAGAAYSALSDDAE